MQTPQPNSEESGHFEEEAFGSGGLFAEINVTPLVDIMLVLLIIFMASTTLMTQDSASSAGIQVDLPKTSAKGGLSTQQEFVVALTREGEIVHLGMPLTLEQLKIKLSEAKRKEPNTIVMLQADQEVTHGRVTQVLDLAKEVGLERLEIATQNQ